MNRSDDGQGLAEYAVILAVLATIALIALIFLSAGISSLFSTIGESLEPGAPRRPPPTVTAPPGGREDAPSPSVSPTPVPE